MNRHVNPTRKSTAISITRRVAVRAVQLPSSALDYCPTVSGYFRGEENSPRQAGQHEDALFASAYAVIRCKP